jgi:hypothetical protein
VVDSWQHRVNAIEIGERAEECRRAARRLRRVIDGTAGSSLDVSYSVRPAVWTSKTAALRRGELDEIAVSLEKIEQHVRDRAVELENVASELDAIESREWRRYRLALQAEETAASVPAALLDRATIDGWTGATSWP